MCIHIQILGFILKIVLILQKKKNMDKIWQIIELLEQSNISKQFKILYELKRILNGYDKINDLDINDDSDIESLFLELTSINNKTQKIYCI